MIGMIRTLAADIDALAPESAAAVADSVTQILIAGLSALPAARQPPVSQLTAFHREQIKALRRGAAGRPRADRWREIAAQLAPVAEHAAPRLGRRGVLARDGSGRSGSMPRGATCATRAGRAHVSEIAFAWGFNDAAHFSRAFRERFGCSPRELRAGG